MDEKNLIESTLSHWVTKTIAIVTTSFAIFRMVILPISNMQIQLDEIRNEIIQYQSDFKGFITEQQQQGSRLDVLETEVKPLLNHY